MDAAVCSITSRPIQKFAGARAAGTILPSNHSPFFTPDVGPALRTAIAAEVAALRNLWNGATR